MNSILEQVCEIAIWVKDSLKKNKSFNFPYSYKNHFIDKINFNMFYSCSDTIKTLSSPNDWLIELKEKGLKNIKIYSSIEEKNNMTLLMPEKQKISLVCLFENNKLTFSPRWVYNNSKKIWNVKYSEIQENKAEYCLKDNTEELNNIINKIISFYSAKIDSFSKTYYDKFNKILNILIDKSYNEHLITKNDNLYLAASRIDDLYCGMGSWYDCCTSQNELELAKELYKQERLAILYCINEL